jgi:hypothetical protein
VDQVPFRPLEFYLNNTPSGQLIPIPVYDLNLFMAFKSFMEIHRGPDGMRDPEIVNPVDFNRYRTSDDFKPEFTPFQNANGYWHMYTPMPVGAAIAAAGGAGVALLPAAPPAVAHAGAPTLTPTERWERKKKRDADKYPELKDDAIFDQYHREFEAQLHIDDCSEIANRTFDRTTLAPDQLEF